MSALFYYFDSLSHEVDLCLHRCISKPFYVWFNLPIISSCAAKVGEDIEKRHCTQLTKLAPLSCVWPFLNIPNGSIHFVELKCFLNAAQSSCVSTVHLLRTHFRSCPLEMTEPAGLLGQVECCSALSPSQIPAGLWYAPVWLASSVRSHNAPSVTEDVHAEQLFLEVFHSVLWFPFLNKDFEQNYCSSKVTLEEVKRNFLWTIGGAVTQVCFICCCVTKAFLILPVIVNGVISFHLIMV